jgi:prepilin-type N-terminal cleavage/methylation domain-containing protein
MTKARGFTVVELMVGVAVAGVVLLVARAAIAEVTSGGRRLIAARAEFDTAANARRWLASAFRSLQVGRGRDDTFQGSPHGVGFTARLRQPAGWFEPERLQLERSGTRLLVRRNTRDSVTLFTGVMEIETHYLLTSGERSEWLRGWYAPSTAPLAARLIIWWLAGDPNRPPAADTLLFLIGSRG